MSNPTPSIRVNVDVTNPGQFFACCGLLELANRLWPGAEGWFEQRAFCIACAGTLADLLGAAKSVVIAGIDDGLDSTDKDDDEEEEDDNEVVAPVEILSPVVLRLDWWADKSIKTWAGSMNVHLIAIAMARAIDPECIDPLNQLLVVYDPPRQIVRNGRRVTPKPKKREPFYFDARRGPNAHSRDVGFSPNDLKIKTTAAPVVEFLCLIGLQRSRPKQTVRPRVFNYFSWTSPIPISLLPAAVSGLLSISNRQGFRFENVFRSGQKKLKTYIPAIPFSQQGE